MRPYGWDDRLRQRREEHILGCPKCQQDKTARRINDNPEFIRELDKDLTTGAMCKRRAELDRQIAELEVPK